MRKSVFSAMMVLAVSAAFGAITGTITTEGGEALKGVIRWSNRDRAYAVERGNTEVQVKPADVAELEIDKPETYDAAVAKLQKGQAEAAIADLKKIVDDYQRLQWDKIAGRYLAEAYVASGKPDKGLRACEEIIRDDASAAYKGALAPAYWGALLALDRQAKLESVLEKAAKSGDRFSMGAALILRGDMALKAGKESNDAAKKALIDGYLRVVLTYNEPEVAEQLLPEALYKAAHCFEKLGLSGRADTMRTQLKRDFASSPWASK